MSNITVYKFVKKISTNLQTVAEKTAKNFGGLLFLPHPVQWGYWYDYTQANCGNTSTVDIPS